MMTQLLLGAAALGALFFIAGKGSAKAPMPQTGDRTTTYTDNAPQRMVMMRFVQSGLGYGWEPIEIDPTSGGKVFKTLDGRTLFKSGSERMIPPIGKARFYKWTPGLNLFVEPPQ